MVDPMADRSVAKKAATKAVAMAGHLVAQRAG